MHRKKHVHKRINPASVRPSRGNRVRLSRLMMVSEYNKNEAPNVLPLAPGSSELFFQSPQRILKRAFPDDPVVWDGKKEDVWGFGCTVYALLMAEYPFAPEHNDLGKLLDAHNSGYLQKRIFSKRLSQGAKDFLLFVLIQNQNKRHSMEEVMNHSWLRTDNPTSPNNTPAQSSDPEVTAKTFRQFRKPIEENLIREMAQSGYAIEYMLGEGGFGAVYR